MISDERKLLVTTPMANGKLRANATINRYTATLSAIFSYACCNLDWIVENPCKRLIKLKEPPQPARNRQLTPHEMTTLLKEAKKSRNSYLYCFILMGFVTGARHRPCRQPTMASGRCRLHGGKCTGPKTEQGKKTIKGTNTKHEYYSMESKYERILIRKLINEVRDNI